MPIGKSNAESQPSSEPFKLRFLDLPLESYEGWKKNIVIDRELIDRTDKNGRLFDLPKYKPKPSLTYPLTDFSGLSRNYRDIEHLYNERPIFRRFGFVDESFLYLDRTDIDLLAKVIRYHPEIDLSEHTLFLTYSPTSFVTHAKRKSLAISTEREFSHAWTSDADRLFVILHELRHVLQAQLGWLKFTETSTMLWKGRITPVVGFSEDHHLDLPHEKDANIFAYQHPLFSGQARNVQYFSKHVQSAMRHAHMWDETFGWQ